MQLLAYKNIVEDFASFYPLGKVQFNYNKRSQ